MKNELGIYRDGRYRENVQKISTGSTSYDLSPDESGSIFWLNTATTMTFNLPKVSSKALGLTYTLALQEQASSDDVKVTCSKFDSSAAIQTAFSSVIDTHTTAIPGSTFFTGGRFTAISTVVWMLEQLTAGYTHVNDATSNMGGWTTG